MVRLGRVSCESCGNAAPATCVSDPEVAKITTFGRKENDCCPEIRNVCRTKSIGAGKVCDFRTQPGSNGVFVPVALEPLDRESRRRTRAGQSSPRFQGRQVFWFARLRLVRVGAISTLHEGQGGRPSRATAHLRLGPLRRRPSRIIVARVFDASHAERLPLFLSPISSPLAGTIPFRGCMRKSVHCERRNRCGSGKRS